MASLSTWISASRLRTLPLSLSGIIVGSAMAFADGYHNYTIFLLAMVTTVSYQILSNLANDYGDGVKGTDNNNRVGPERALQSGSISPLQMKRGIVLMVFVAIITTLALIFNSFETFSWYIPLFVFLGIAAIVAAIKYTVGETAYGYKGLGDIFVFVFFGLVSVVGVYFLYSKEWDWEATLPGITIGLLSTAVLNLNNMRDMESDKNTGKNTLAVKLGEKKVKVYHSWLIIISIVASLIYLIINFQKIWNVIFLVAFIPILLHLRKVLITKDLKRLDPELKKLALSTFLLAILFYMSFNIFS